MTSPNNHPRGTHGSALVVTILLVSVMLAAALILLQRIIPYAKNVRGMNDAMQSYYTARGQAEAGRLGFFYTGGESVVASFRLPTLFGLLSQTSTSTITNIFTARTLRPDVIAPLPDGYTAEAPRQTDGTFMITRPGNTPVIQNIIQLALPNLALATRKNRDFVVNSVSPELPLKIKLYTTDTNPAYFGTSKRDPAYHTLDPNNAGGLRFDFRGVDTDIISNFALGLLFSTVPPIGSKITLKIQYADDTSVKTFTNISTIPANLTAGTPYTDFFTESTGNTQTINPDGTIDAAYSQSLNTFLNINNCQDTDVCSLSLTLSDTTSPLDFQLISTGSTPVSIPDLNAVVVGDGLSDNGLYFQRVVDLIPTRQDI